MNETAWRDWYELVIANVDTLDAGRLIASWRDKAEPAFYAHDGSPVERAEGMSRPGFTLDALGVAWKLPDGRVVRDREEATAIASALGYLEDPTVVSFIEAMPSGHATLPNGSRARSKTSLPTIARALVIAGLVRDGVSMRAACRLWLHWDGELGGGLAPTYDPTDRDEARAAEDKTAMQVRRTLDGLGIQLRPGL